jgi:hypothetical protein
MGQKWIAHNLSRPGRKQGNGKGTEIYAGEINYLPAGKESEKPNQRSMNTHPWDRNQRLTGCQNQSGDQWTEFRGTGINDLQPVEAFRKPNW